MANFGVVPEESISRLKREIQNIKREDVDNVIKSDTYSLRLRQSEIKHLLDNGYTEAETVERIMQIPEIVGKFDKAVYSPYVHNGTRRHGILFYKTFPDGTERTYLAVSNKHSNFTGITDYTEDVGYKKASKKNKKKSSPMPDDSSPSITSETGGSSTPVLRIAETGEKSKPQKAEIDGRLNKKVNSSLRRI